MSTSRKDFADVVTNYLKYMVNVETLEISINFSGSESNNVSSTKKSEVCKLTSLKCLTIQMNLKNHANLPMLSLSPWLKSCIPEVLQSLTVKLPNWKCSINIILSELQHAELNLKSFDITLQSIRDSDISALLLFMKSQENLESFAFEGTASVDFLLRFGELIPDFVKLKLLKLNFRRSILEYQHFNVSKCWKIEKLEKLDISGILGRNLAESILHCASNNLKSINARGIFHFDFSCLEKKFNQFKNLVELKICGTLNITSSNSIFLILKSLKKLQILNFVFLEDNDFDETFFDNNEDLSLPEIKDVTFTFNRCIYNRHISKFMKLLTNMSTFSIYIQNNVNEKSLNIVSKKLPKLKNLNCRNYGTIKYSVLQKIQSNILTCNEKPHLFKFNGKKVEFWTEDEWRKDLMDRRHQFLFI